MSPPLPQNQDGALTTLILPRVRGVCINRGVRLPVPKMADTSGFLEELLGVTTWEIWDKIPMVNQVTTFLIRIPPRMPSRCQWQVKEWIKPLAVAESQDLWRGTHMSAWRGTQACDGAGAALGWWLLRETHLAEVGLELSQGLTATTASHTYATRPSPHKLKCCSFYLSILFGFHLTQDSWVKKSEMYYNHLLFNTKHYDALDLAIRKN